MTQLRAKQIKLDAGSLLVGNAAGSGSALALGTAGQILKIVGGGLQYADNDSSAMAFTPVGTIEATTVQDAIAEVATDAAAALATAQAEIDATQAGAGLGTDGAYVATTEYVAETNETGTHYIFGATSLHGADLALDAALKSLADDVALLDADTSLQTAIDAIEAAAGLSTDGAYVANEDANYIADATSLFDADIKLDTALAATDLVVDGIDAELTATQAAAGLNADGTLGTWTGSDELELAASLKAGIEAVDARISAVAGLNALRFAGEVSDTSVAGDIAAATTGDMYRATAAAADMAGTGLNVNAGDYIVKTADGWVKFDNTDPAIAVAAAETALVIDGDINVGFELSIDQGEILFANLGDAGTPVAGNFMRWGAAGVEYVSAADMGVASRVEVDFVKSAAETNSTLTLTRAPTGDVAVFFNGMKLLKTGYTVAGSVVTLVDSVNGYGVEAGDVISVSYDSNEAA